MRELTSTGPLRSAGLVAAAALLAVEASRLFARVPVDGADGADGGHADGGLARPPSPAVARARRLLDERCAQPWRIAELARGSGLSAGHLSELFPCEVGLPPYRYLLERRVERAAELLAGSDLPITGVALEAGFGSGPHLARAFRQATGCSPREFRRQHQDPA